MTGNLLLQSIDFLIYTMSLSQQQCLNNNFYTVTCVFPSLDSNQMNNVVQTSTLITQPYFAVGQITSPYEQQTSVKDFNKYATLKAVGKMLFTVDELFGWKSSCYSSAATHLISKH